MIELSLRPHQGLTNKQIIKSVSLHIAIILIFTVNAYWFPAEDLNFENAIRVDIVGLPEKLKHLPPAEPAKEVAKPSAPPKVETAPVPPTPVPVPAVDDKKIADAERKKAQLKAVEKLKAMEKLSEMEDEEIKDAKKNVAVAGNEVSTGNALTGIRQNQISSYISLFRDHVQKNWKLPQWMADSKLRAEAVVMLDAKGVVINRIITKGSGNSGFDDSILEAIDQSSPFPPPPPALVGTFKNKGFTLGFPE